MKDSEKDFSINEAVESENDYSMANEICCSPEFPQGCVSNDREMDF